MINRIESFDFYLLRNPLLSYGSILALNKANSKQDLEAKLREIYSSADLQNAIFLASQVLHKEMLKWLTDPTVIAKNKLLLSLYKYTIRMGVRATPYGMFAGISQGRVAETSSIILSEEKKAHTRLDMSIVSEIAHVISETTDIRSKLIFFPNNSLYKIGDSYRYYEHRFLNGKRNYYLIYLKSSPAISTILKVCEKGALYSDLTNTLLRLNISKSQAESFLNALTDKQILVSELEPTLTGEEFFGVLRKTITRIDSNGKYAAVLKEIYLLLKEPESFTFSTEKIKGLINHYFVSAEGKNLLQTDLTFLAKENTIKKNVINTIAQNIKELLPLNRAQIPSELKQFIKQFKRTYGDRYVPLLEVIDDDFGIGYGSTKADYYQRDPLIGGISINRKNKEIQSKWTPYQQIAVDLLLQSKEKGSYEVQLTQEQLKKITLLPDQYGIDLPGTFHAIGNLIAENCKKLDQGDFQFNLIACGGPSAIPLMARFGHCDPLLVNKLKACVRVEEQKYPQAILAEIIHLPESRTGNILQRPKVRGYEIPFLSQSSSEFDQQILLTDLVVGIEDNKLILRSEKLQKVIIPRLSTAHNFQNGISVYRFLADLQYQDSPFAIKWDWEILNDQEFLPRVSYKKIILSRARWLFKPTTYIEVNNLKSNEDINLFRKKYKLPQLVMLAEGDNELLIDFYSVFGIEVFLGKLRKGNVILLEFLFAEGDSPVKNINNEVFTNELIIPFRSFNQVSSSPVIKKGPTILQRSFPPGSEWTYLKIYCGPGQADEILTGPIARIIEQLTSEHLILKWFFIRYKDPDNHIRVRFLHDAKCKDQFAGLAVRIHSELKESLDAGIVQHLQYDTYDRELERYGITSMKESEDLFYHDSLFVLKILKKLDKNSENRWLIAAYGVDQILAAAGMETKEKLELTTKWRADFFKEFNGDSNLNYQLNDTYRKNKADLESFMKREHNFQKNTMIMAFFEARESAFTDILGKIKIHAYNKVTENSLFSHQLLPSYIHMFMNRLFFTEQRFYELAVYHCLTKFYATISAKRLYINH